MTTPIHPADTAMRHPLRELLSRYRAVFQHAWAHRAELAGPARHANELAFLPAALSLQDTPVHPAPRRLAWGLMILFVLALLWSILGKVDIVAVAPGRIIVSDRTVVISGCAVIVSDGTVVISDRTVVVSGCAVVVSGCAVIVSGCAVVISLLTILFRIVGRLF